MMNDKQCTSEAAHDEWGTTNATQTSSTKAWGTCGNAIGTTVTSNISNRRPREIAPSSFHRHNHAVSTATTTTPASASASASPHSSSSTIHISSIPKRRHATALQESNLLLRTTLAEAAKRVDDTKYREVNQQLKLQRSVHREVTSVKIFLFQDVALHELDRLMTEYLFCKEINESVRIEKSMQYSNNSSSNGRDRSIGHYDNNNHHYYNVGNENLFIDNEDVSCISDTSSSIASTLSSSLQEKDDDDDIDELRRRKQTSNSGCCGAVLVPATKHLFNTKSNSGLVNKSDKSNNNNKKASSASPSSSSNTLEKQIHRFRIKREMKLGIVGPLDPAREDLLPPLWSLEPRIFAREVSSSGKRKYMVGNFGRFIDHYWRKIEHSSRHYYELIQEGVPCRLYFDLEYYKQSNSSNMHGLTPKVTEEQLMTEFIEELIIEIQNQFQLSITRSHIIDLDSSTDVKFSRHLIVHMPQEQVFENNASMGVFVKNFVGRLAEEVATGVLVQRGRAVLANYLFVNSKSVINRGPLHVGRRQEIQHCNVNLDPIGRSSQVGESTAVVGNDTPCDVKDTQLAYEKTCFIDLGVYTRNRLFRLLGSSKYGKPSSAALRIASASTFLFPKNFYNDNFYVCDSRNLHGTMDGPRLIYQRDIDLNNQPVSDTSGATKLDWSAHAEALAMTLITPLNWSKIRFPILYLPKEISGTKENVAQSQRLHGTNTSIRGKSQFSSSRQGSLGQSPFPCLDRFVADVLALRGGTAGEVRGWFVEKMQHSETKVPAGHGANRSEMSTLQSITYQMLRNRWCENVGREHKSNNVMWTIDLISLEYWQSCHDPDCKAVGFRGKRMALPKDVVSKLRENLLDISLAQVDESVLLKVAAQTQTEVQRPLADDEDFERALLQLDISGQL